MSSYLNSCLRVPLDPCNNCPAPLFGRSKMYLGCLSIPPNKPDSTAIPKRCAQSTVDSKGSCGRGIRSLARLYDSIPDYRDINHLSGEEFYSTLNSLRSTCQELKLVTSPLSCEGHYSVTSTPTSIISSDSRHLAGNSGKKCKKSKKKRKSNQNQNCKKVLESQMSKSATQQRHENCTEPAPTKAPHTSISKAFLCEKQSKLNTIHSNFTCSSKKDLDEEVEQFKKSLQQLEAEFKRPLASLPCRSSKEHIAETKGGKMTPNVKASMSRERLRKSLSFNDLHSIADPPELSELRKQNNTLELLSFKGGSKSVHGATKLSNYFQKHSTPIASELPKIVVGSPSTEQSCGNRLRTKKATQKSDNNHQYRMPFELFNLDVDKKQRSKKRATPSPIHPVARPNLAATLREESSKKKVKELKNNCTYHDAITQFDWEVRKTPAWKSLSLNETHKEILQLRLATRKAEQALQQREYELNMELMRQRVKSAPLLLEGSTFWGPQVGKLSHACQKEGRRHTCQSNLLRSRRSKNSSRSCRRRMFFNTSPALKEANCSHSANTFRTESGNGITHKLNTLRKIYNSGTNGAKSRSRNSSGNRSGQECSKYEKKKDGNEEPYKEVAINSPAGVDSDDELSSLDRAFL